MQPKKKNAQLGLLLTITIIHLFGSMDQLPSDILVNIFIQLHFKQKKKCMLVCRFWKNVISSRCLYHTLEVEKEDFAGLLNFMDRNPSLKTQVVDLTLSIGEPSLKKEAVKYFPNLQEFSYFSRSKRSMTNLESSSVTCKSRMRKVHEQGGCEFLVELSKNGRCTHLTEIGISYFKPDAVLPVLKEMPLLTTLQLSHTTITLTQLEVIHADIPSIEKLGVYFNNLDERFPTSVTPAASLTTLSIHLEHLRKDQQLSWLQYVTEKYPRLENYNLETNETGGSQDVYVTYNYLYSVAYIPFLKKLGPQLISINLACAQCDNYKVLERMDEFGCRLKKIEIQADDKYIWQSALSQTNQRHYLEDITIHRMDSDSFDWLGNMNTLKSLKLDFKSFFMPVIHLCAFFKLCSKSVKSIDFIGASFCTMDENEFEHSHQIERIGLSCNQIPENLDAFISKCLPNLHHLEINTDLPIDYRLHLPHHHFSYVELFFYRHGFYNFSVTTLNNSECKRFRPIFKKTQINHSTSEKFLKPTEEDDFHDEPFVDLVFGSIRVLILRDREALLI